jgi:hypothetical protein
LAFKARHVGLEEEGRRKANASGPGIMIGTVFDSIRIEVAAEEWEKNSGQCTAIGKERTRKKF